MIPNDYFKKILKHTSSIIIIFFITFLLAEVALRIYHHFKPIRFFYDNSYNQFRGKPYEEDYFFNLNSKGFKDLEYDKKKSARYRVLGIGDSFSFGTVPYRYNYLTRLEDQLKEKKLDVEIINMGIPGIGPREYLSLLIHEGLDCQPDMVLLSFFIGNDFDDCRGKEKKRKLYSYSYVACFFNYLFKIKNSYQGKRYHRRGRYCDHCASFDKKTYLGIESTRSHIYINPGYSIRQGLKSACFYLSEIKKICKLKGIEFVVVIIPDEMQVNPILANKIKKNYFPDVPDREWDLTNPERSLVTALNKMEIPFIDLCGDFVIESQKRRLYRLRDTHWNIAGNDFAAKLILSYLLTHFFQQN